MQLMRTPKKVDISITNRCNLRCGYCYHFDSPGETEQDLPAEAWLPFFEELGQLAVMDVTLAGGEPFIREDLHEIICGIVQNRMRFSILSNGTLITEEMAYLIASTNRCDVVQVSIDGSIPAAHDVFRGRGSFRKAIQGIKTLQNYGVPVTVRVTIHRENVHDLEGISRFLLEDLGLRSFGTNSAGEMGLCRKSASRIQLTADERLFAMESLLTLSEKYNGRIQAMAGPLAEAKMWLGMEQSRLRGLSSMPNRGTLSACGCIWQSIAVRADGVMVPCAMLSHIELGRINRDPLLDIWHEHPEMKSLRKRRNIPLPSFEFCNECDYVNYCTGNCPAIAYSVTGELNQPAPDACLRKYLNEGGRLPAVGLIS